MSVCPTVETILTGMIAKFEGRARTPREHKLTPRALEREKAKDEKAKKEGKAKPAELPETVVENDKTDLGALRWLQSIGILDVEIWKAQHETRHLNWFTSERHGTEEDPAASMSSTTSSITDSSSTSKKSKKPKKKKKEKK
jgi:hypothetical protein